MTKDELYELRKQMAISQNKGGYGYLNTGDIAQKKYKMRKDPLSPDQRAKVDAAKERINQPESEGDLW